MIEKREILDIATAQSLGPSIIEKDHVLGWLLWGISQHEDLAESCGFKGGTCLKNATSKPIGFRKTLILP